MRYFSLFILLLSACSKPDQQKATSTTPAEYYKPDPATAARVRGKVLFSGRKPPAKAISMNTEEACEELHDKPVLFSPVQTGKDGGLANVFVYIKSGLEDLAFEPPKETVVIDQRGCQYVPRVVALRAGQLLTVKNSDPVSHNIHPVPVNNREWNQQQPPGAPDLQRKFARPEVMIPVKCNVHNWMRSFVGVLDHPYFTVTGDTGAFEWDSVPAGEYTITAWHETLGELTQKIALARSSEQEVTFTFRLPSEKE